MDRLEIALRRYRQIVPTAVGRRDQLPLREVKVWLSEYVLPALENVSARPKFRDYASWPIRNLRRGVTSVERGLVDQSDVGLQACAKALAKLVDRKGIRRKLDELNPPKIRVVREVAEFSARGMARKPLETSKIDELDVEVVQLHCIARRDWNDLVNVQDYFEPQQEWICDKDGNKVQRGEWLPSFNPELLPIGNFVVRCLLKRIKIRMELLGSMIRKCDAALANVSSTHAKIRKDVEASWGQIQKLYKKLQDSLRSGHEARIRDACIAATQVYAAVHLSPKLDWLGIDLGLEVVRSTFEMQLNHSRGQSY